MIIASICGEECQVPPIVCKILHLYRGGRVQSFERFIEISRSPQIFQECFGEFQKKEQIFFQESFRIPQKVKIILERDQSVNNLGTCKVIVNQYLAPRCLYKQRCHSFVRHHSTGKAFSKAHTSLFQSFLFCIV